MGSFRGNCEIIEAKDEQSTTQRPQTLRQLRAHGREQKPPIVKKGSNKTLEDDINKLFEAVNLRSSKSLDLSDIRRNASKKPMRSTGSHSPGIGFSEPVSLKQALRGLCISQAAEMAAMKRLSMPASPRVSESGKFNNMSRSVVVETGESGYSPVESGEHGIEISLVPEESTSSSSHMMHSVYRDPVVNSAPQSSGSSPRFGVKPVVKNSFRLSSLPPAQSSGAGIALVKGETSTKTESLKEDEPNYPLAPPGLVFKRAEPSIVHNEVKPVSLVDNQSMVTGLKEKDQNLISTLPHSNADDNLSKQDQKLIGLNKVASVPSKDSATSVKIVDKAAPKLRKKSRLQNVSSSPVVKGNKDVRPTRSTSRAVKPVIRNKNLVIKKSKKLAVSTDENPSTSNEVNGDQDHGTEQQICQRCQCSLRDTSTDSSKDPLDSAGTEEFTGSVDCDAGRGTSVVKSNIPSKPCMKGDISQSSKSSNCDFSSSTNTSLSDESNLSGSSCSNRPHMSKDMRWEVINHIKKQYGFLGLSHFNLLKKLGSGDIGTVYLAELIGTNCPFAIKVMDNEFLARRKKMSRAQTEREILRMLDHPFLPTLYAQFTSDNLSCLVMDFCPGGDLHVLRQRQPGRYFPEQAARYDI